MLCMISANAIANKSHDSTQLIMNNKTISKTYMHTCTVKLDVNFIIS